MAHRQKSPGVFKDANNARGYYRTVGSTKDQQNVVEDKFGSKLIFNPDEGITDESVGLVRPGGPRGSGTGGGNGKQDFNLGETLAAIGRFLKENPVKASYSPGSSGARGTTSDTFGIDTGYDAAIKRQAFEDQERTKARYKGKVLDASGNFVNKPTKPTTWSFNKNASPYAQDYRAKVKASMRLDPAKSKSPRAINEIMNDPQLDSNEKFEILKTLDPSLIKLLMERGISGES